MAEQRVNRYREEMDAKRILQIRDIARELPQSCGDFLRSIAISTSTLTRLAYAIDLNTFFTFLHNERIHFSEKPLRLMDDSDLEKLDRTDIVAYTEYLTYYFKNTDDVSVPNKVYINHELSIKRKLCSIRSFYDYLFKNQRISSNVTELVPLPKIHEKPIIRLSKDEMSRMLELAQSGDQLTEHQQKFQKITARRDFAILSLFLGTGIRVSECVGINIGDVDLENNAFIVTRKGGNQVVLYFPPEVAEALADYMQERSGMEAVEGHEDALFLSLQRKRITQRAVQNLVKKYASVAAPLKTRISPHKLRSTYATNLYNETGDIYLVADVLGHTSVDTTRKHYASISDDTRRKAIMNFKLREDENDISANNDSKKNDED